MSDTLKPCPFCGGTPYLDAEEDSGTLFNRCDDCGCFLLPNRKSSADADAAWNTRALDEASFRAGIEAAIAWFTSDDASTGDHMVDMHYRELANELRALPIPPQAALNPRG